MALGWSPSGVLKVREWKPYYPPRRRRVLRDGETLLGVSVRLEAGP